jgi:hypothetical protein
MPTGNLPQNIAATYADSPTDPSVAQHQLDHDIIHSIVDKLQGLSAPGVTITADVLIEGTANKFLTQTERTAIAHVQQQVADLIAAGTGTPNDPGATTDPNTGTTTTTRARTLLGACPIKPGSFTGDVVMDKWGEGVALRRFWSTSGFPTSISKNPRAGLEHISFYLSPADTTAFPTDTTLQNACLAALRSIPVADRPKIMVEALHEGDEKVNRGTAAGWSIPQVIAAKNKFYELAKSVDPNFLVVATYTAWLFDPDNTGKNPDAWGTVKADVLGLDYDGVHSYPYPEYSDEVVRLKAFLTKWGGASGYYKYWTVPEFNTSRGNHLTAGVDTNGTERAAWMKQYADLFSSPSYTAVGAALAVMWYDYESSAGVVVAPGSAEFTQWKALCDASKLPPAAPAVRPGSDPVLVGYSPISAGNVSTFVVTLPTFNGAALSQVDDLLIVANMHNPGGGVDYGNMPVGETPLATATIGTTNRLEFSYKRLTSADISTGTVTFPTYASPQRPSGAALVVRNAGTPIGAVAGFTVSSSTITPPTLTTTKPALVFTFIGRRATGASFIGATPPTDQDILLTPSGASGITASGTTGGGETTLAGAVVGAQPAGTIAPAAWTIPAASTNHFGATIAVPGPA